MKHPSSPKESPTATCYVCLKIRPKVGMVNVGWDKERDGWYVYRCEECETGSASWLKNFMHKSPMRQYYVDTAAAFKITQEKRKARGKELAKANRSRRRQELPKKSRSTPPPKVERREVKDIEHERRKEQSWRNITIRRSR